MSNLQVHLEKRVEALFNDSKRELLRIAENVVSSIPRNAKSNPLENLSEKFNESGITIKKLSDELLDFSNNSLSDFEKEIDTVQEPEKSNAIEKYRDLLISEMQDLIKEGFRDRILK